MSVVANIPSSNAEAPREGAREGAIVFPGAAQEVLDLRHLLGALRRHKVLIAGTMFVMTSLAVLFVNQITPLYKAEAQLVIEASRQNVVDIEAVVQGLNPDWMTNETEAAVIGSRELAIKAVERLNLANSPLFNSDLGPPPKKGLVASLVGSVKALLPEWVFDPARLFGGGRAEEAEEAPAVELSPEESRALALHQATDAYLGGLSVVPEESSRVITVQYNSPDPQMAALAANTTAEIYILDQLSTRGEATLQATEWLSERVNEMRDRVVDSETRLEEFRRESGIVEVGGATIYQRQRAALNEELILARTQRAEARARYGQINDLLEAGEGIDTVAAVLGSPLIQNLRGQEATVVRKIAVLRVQYREGHPQMQLTLTELADLREKIAIEVGRIVDNLGNELEIAQVREVNLEREVRRLDNLLGEQNQAEVTLRGLESEVRANKQLYETLLTRFKETSVQHDEMLQQADARIISRATVPGGPYYPRKRLMIMAALVVSLVIGVALALISELLDFGFRNLSQIETYTGLPTMGVVPMISGLKAQGKLPHEIAVERPNSAYGEAIRTLRTGLLLSRADQPPRSVIVTSSVPGEGKTATALALACTAAKSSQKVIIIDCDLRHSMLHVCFDCPNGVGLSDYLAGQAALEDVIEIDPRSGVHFITAGSRAPNPPDLLGSREAIELLQRLTQLYDMVVLDTPPLLAVSDALVLVRHVDKTLFLVRWEKTRRDVVLMGLKQVIEAGADLAGIVLSLVDVRKQAKYDYTAASGYYYYGSYRKYYTE